MTRLSFSLLIVGVAAFQAVALGQTPTAFLSDALQPSEKILFLTAEEMTEGREEEPDDAVCPSPRFDRRLP
jgi:hypothetical protein